MSRRRPPAPWLLRSAGALLGSVLSVGAMVAPLRAQTMPAPGDTDLTTPPEMRNGAPRPAMVQKAPAVWHGHGSAHRHLDPEGGTTAKVKAARTATGDEHPVELGVTMRGGSATPRVHAQTGGSEAIGESGSALGAAMKFGF